MPDHAHKHSLQHEIGKRKPFDSPCVEAFLNAIRTASVLEAPVQRLLARHALSTATYNVLRILRGAADPHAPEPGPVPGRTCSEIGRDLVTLVPDVTRLVDRLEKLALVERRRCTEDRRVVYVRITRKGLDLLSKIDAPLLELHESQFAHMTRAELADLSRLLVKARRPDPDA